MEKKKSYPKSNLHSVILSVFIDNPFKAFNNKQLAHILHIKDKSEKRMIYSVLENLREERVLNEVKKGKYRLSPDQIKKLDKKKKFMTGTVDLKKTGKAYIIPDEEGEDIYIAPNNVHHALNGDHVKVLLFPKRKNHKTEGQIVEVLERKKMHFVGIFEKQKNFGFVLPDSQSMPYDIFIPKEKFNNAKTGQKVVANITEWPDHANNPFGEIIKVLGQPGDNNVEMQAILVDNDFPLSFPDAVEKEAADIKFDISDSEIKNRKDYRDIWTVTIDPADAKDFDDALSIKPLENGLWEVGVHIADVSHFVTPKTKLNAEAYKRGTSIYLVDRVIPMLPEKLSNGVCSLRPDEDKLTFSVIFTINDKAEVIDKWFGKTVIRSNRRFSYEEVQKIIDENGGEFSQQLLKLNDLASILRKQRFKNGAINFHTPEIRFKLDEKGKPIETYVKESKEANHLVEEFMLLANKSVAIHVGKVPKNKVAKTFVYRVHDQPNPEKLNAFVQFLGKLGYSLSLQSHEKLAQSYNKLLQEVKGKGEENLVENIAIRTMAKAYYSTDNIGHYGLAFPFYTHFTSPIRRYPDLVVHRLLERYLEGKSSVNKETYEEICKHSSEMEKRAADAERDSIKYKQVEFLLGKTGKIFDGQISGVSKWGIFVELIESKSEGLVRFNDMKDDYYYLDEDNYQIIGKKYGQKLRLGDKVKVLVKKVDLAHRQLDFELVENIQDNNK